MAYDLEQLRQQHDIADYIGRHVKLKRQGTEFKGLSPFQKEKTPSFTVVPGRQFFYDFSSGVGGDLLDFIQIYHRVTLPEACEILGGQRVEPSTKPTMRSAPESDLVIPAEPVPDSHEPFAAGQSIRAWNPREGGRSVTYRPDHVWPYHSADGELLGYVLRIDLEHGKFFVPLRYTAHGWTTQHLPTPRPFYNLPALSMPGQVFLVEGEKSADACQALLGFPSLSWGGSNAPAHVDFSPLHGRRVVVWGDADAPGEKAATSVAKRAVDAGASEVKIIPWDHDKPKGWDAADARDGWSDPETGEISDAWDRATALAWLKSKAVIFNATDAPDPEPESEATQTGPKKFTRERFDDIEPNATEWLIKHFMPAHGVGIIYGKSTVGKSFVVLEICMSIARGEPFLGHRTRKSGVLYFAAEGQNGMRKRIKALREERGISAPAFQYIGDTLNMMADDHVAALSQAACECRDEMIEDGLDLGLIVIDTTSASMPGGNENAGEDMSVVLQAAQKIGQSAGCTVLFIAHPGKNEALGVRGWSGQGGNVDAVYYLAPDEQDPKLRIGIVQKLKDGEDGERFAYRLEQIQMGQDEDGEPVTSAYPVFEDAPIVSLERRKKRPEDRPGPQIIMRAIYHMLEAGQSQNAPTVPGVPTGQMAVLRRDVRERAIQLGYADVDDKPETIRRSINRDIQSLIAANTLREDGEFIWPLR